MGPMGTGGKRGLGGAGLLALVAGMAFLLWSATALPDFATLDWTEVRGTVVRASLEVVTRKGSKGRSRHVTTARVLLRYGAHGKEWTSTLAVRLPRNWKEGDARTSDYVPEYPPGKEVVAFAHPEDPVRLAGRRGPHPATWIALLVAGLAAAGAWHLRGRGRPA
jgi:hypothetical protein